MKINWYRATSLFFAFLSAAFVLAVVSTLVRADPLAPAGSSEAGNFADRFAGKIPLAAPKLQDVGECPDANPCKILTLNAQEERILTGQNGILDTAAQGRAIDLGQFAVYLKQRIASAPAGETKQPEKPAVQGNPDKGAGPEIPAAKQ